MTKPPQSPPTQGAPPAEDLDEIEVESVFGEQQTAEHAPAQRAQVAIDDRSVVIAEEPPDPLDTAETQQLPPYEPPAVRSPRAAAATIVLPRRRGGKGRKRWVTILIWGAAGLLAFGLGGALALLTADRAAAPPSPPPGSPGTLSQPEKAATP